MLKMLMTQSTYALLRIQGPIADGPLTKDTILCSGHPMSELPYSTTQWGRLIPWVKWGDNGCGSKHSTVDTVDLNQINSDSDLFPSLCWLDSVTPQHRPAHLRGSVYLTFPCNLFMIDVNWSLQCHHPVCQWHAHSAPHIIIINC